MLLLNGLLGLVFIQGRLLLASLAIKESLMISGATAWILLHGWKVPQNLIEWISQPIHLILYAINSSVNIAEKSLSKERVKLTCTLLLHNNSITLDRSFLGKQRYLKYLPKCPTTTPRTQRIRFDRRAGTGFFKGQRSTQDLNKPVVCKNSAKKHPLGIGSRSCRLVWLHMNSTLRRVHHHRFWITLKTLNLLSFCFTHWVSPSKLT